MNVGNLQRRWSAVEPPVYDKETRIVCLDIKPEAQTSQEGEEQQGFSYIPVQIDRQFDYGHVKSQLIEAGFPQKDEDTEAVSKFSEFNAFRKICADAAKVVMSNY